ncbi:MAG: Hsp20/alpha crystallin family protein [Gammaproteobacteria bacterium]|nr:Hsp20/alpha crystallin family protein [Gammaproteobacteria bacterium]
MSTITPRAIRRRSAPQTSVWGNDFNNVFESFFRPDRWLEEATSEDLVPAMDIREREHDFLVQADMPGIRKEDIDINLESGVLTITAETRQQTEEEKAGRLLRQERRYGRYVRSLRLGRDIDGSKVKAVYEDGVLEIVLPKAEAAKPKKISVDVK